MVNLWQTDTAIITWKESVVKERAFFENAEYISEKFQILPLMYGSLGLEYITGECLNSDDIDILIPEIFIRSRWDEFRTALEEAVYVLTDAHEHTFRKDGIDYSYASIEELEAFADIPVSEIAIQEQHGTPFRLLSLEQYLKVYEASAKDGYRANVRNKKDHEKIDFIKKHLNLRRKACSTMK